MIKAINSDMPFDQFTIEQIAGDLLPDATPEQKIATGFHRNTPINTEGGIDYEEYRVVAEPLSAPGSSSPVMFSGAAAEIDPVLSGIRRALDGEPTTGWSNGDAALDDSDPTGSSHKNRVERQAIFVPGTPLGFPGGTRLTIPDCGIRERDAAQQRSSPSPGQGGAGWSPSPAGLSREPTGGKGHHEPALGRSFRKSLGE